VFSLSVGVKNLLDYCHSKNNYIITYLCMVNSSDLMGQAGIGRNMEE